MVRVDLPRGAPVVYVQDWILQMYQDHLPDSGEAPWVCVLYRDRILRFDFRDGPYPGDNFVLKPKDHGNE